MKHQETITGNEPGCDIWMLFDWAVHGYVGAVLTDTNNFLEIGKLYNVHQSLVKLTLVGKTIVWSGTRRWNAQITEQLQMNWVHLSLLSFVRLCNGKKKKTTTTPAFVKENQSAWNMKRKKECSFIIFFSFGCGLMGNSLTQGFQKQQSTTVAQLTSRWHAWLYACMWTVMVMPRG